MFIQLRKRTTRVIAAAVLLAAPPPIAVSLSSPALARPARAPFQESATLVISEFRTRGPNGATDEFVELFNLSSGPVDAGAFELWGSNGSGGTSRRLTIPEGTTLLPGCRLLLAQASGYSGDVPADLTYGVSIADDGGIALCNGPCSDPESFVDQVGMSGGSAYLEGTPLAPLTESQEQSYERQPAGVNTQDSDDNATDFFLNQGTSNPQNSGFDCSPLAITLAGFGAEAAADHILITWETASEVDTLGFQLYRRTQPKGPEDLLAFVPSQAPDSLQGFQYGYQDFAVAAGQAYWYWLEDIDLYGMATRHGPIQATFEAPAAAELVVLTANSARAAGISWPWAAGPFLTVAGLAWLWRRRS